MKKNMTFSVCIIFSLLFLIANCEEEIIRVPKFILYYTKYIIKDNVLTFEEKDEILEKAALQRQEPTYKTYYDDMQKIIKVEILEGGVISSRQLLDSDGNVTRIDEFENGILIGYRINVYDEEETNIKIQKEYFDKNDKLKKVELFFFGHKEIVNYYDSSGRLSKSQSYLKDKVDITKLFDARGNIAEEKGTYDNGRYPYSLKYVYDKNDNLVKVEHRQSNQLHKIHHYNKDGRNVKEEIYGDSDKLIDTIFFDSEGNPLRK